MINLKRNFTIQCYGNYGEKQQQQQGYNAAVSMASDITTNLTKILRISFQGCQLG